MATQTTKITDSINLIINTDADNNKSAVITWDDAYAEEISLNVADLIVNLKKKKQ